MLLNPLTYHAPKTVLEAAQLYANLTEARILAGGTFLLNNLKQLKKKGLKTPKNIVSLRHIDELKGIFADDEKLIIRAMTVINDVFNSPLLTDNFAVLKTVCRNISTNPIRNMATVGGNLTSRYTWTELGAVLMALEANMHFTGPDGKEEVIAVEDFFKNNARSNTIFTHVSIKRNKEHSFAYKRQRKLSYVDVPMMAVCLRTTFREDRFTNTRAVINNCVNFAQRDIVLEDFLNNFSCRHGIAQEALDHLDTKIYDTRGDDYKKTIFRVSIKNAISDLINQRRNEK